MEPVADGDGLGGRAGGGGEGGGGCCFAPGVAWGVHVSARFVSADRVSGKRRWWEGGEEEGRKEERGRTMSISDEQPVDLQVPAVVRRVHLVHVWSGERVGPEGAGEVVVALSLRYDGNLE